MPSSNVQTASAEKSDSSFLSSMMGSSKLSPDSKKDAIAEMTNSLDRAAATTSDGKSLSSTINGLKVTTSQGKVVSFSELSDGEKSGLYGYFATNYQIKNHQSAPITFENGRVSAITSNDQKEISAKSDASLSTSFDSAKQTLSGMFSAGVEAISGILSPKSLQNILEGFIKGVGTALEWGGEGLKLLLETLSDPKFWERIGKQVLEMANNLFNAVTSALEKGWTAIQETLTDPKKRAEFFRKVATGEILVDIVKAAGTILQETGKLLVQAYEGIGLKDLVGAIGCCFTGDFDGATKHLKKAGEKAGNFSGIGDVIQAFRYFGEGIQKHDKSIFSKGLESLAVGAVKIGLIVFVGAQANELLQSARAVLTTFAYRDVASEAVTVAYNALGKESYATIESTIGKQQLTGMGEQVARDLGQFTTKILDNDIEKVVGRSIFGTTESLPEEMINRIVSHFSEKQAQEGITKQVFSKAENLAEKTTDDIFKQAAEKSYQENKKFYQDLTKKVQVEHKLNLLADTLKKDGFKVLQKLDGSEIQALVEKEFPQLTSRQAERTAKAMKHIVRDNWKYSKSTKGVAVEAYTKGLADDFIEGPYGSTFRSTWSEEVSGIKTQFDTRSINLEESFYEDVTKAGNEGFESGVRKSCRKFAERLFREMKEEQTPKKPEEDKKKKDKKAEDKKEQVVENTEGGAYKIHDSTIDELKYKDMDKSRKSWTIEQEIDEIARKEAEKFAKASKSKDKDTLRKEIQSDARKEEVVGAK